MRSLELRVCDGVTSRDGVTLGRRDGATLSDVIGHLAPELPVGTGPRDQEPCAA